MDILDEMTAILQAKGKPNWAVQLSFSDDRFTVELYDDANDESHYFSNQDLAVAFDQARLWFMNYINAL